MQTTRARPQAQRADGDQRPSGGRGRRLAVAIPLFLFAFLASLAVLAFVAVVGVYAALSRDLDDPRKLEQIGFVQESVVYDRTNTVELARFSTGERREVVTFDRIPEVLIDATTAVEDRSFWTNTGFDPIGIVAASADSLRGDVRGASTITQQLVRQRLLDAALVQDPDRRVERKIKEIIQSIRVTEAFPGEEGKRRIITAYLNQNFYGNNSYGVSAAAKGYFDIDDLSELTIAQAAILAALPQSPTNHDLVRNAVEDAQGRLIVPADSPIVERRNYILGLLADDPTRRVLTGDDLTTEDFEAAMEEEVVLVDQGLPDWKAPHFVWAVRDQLAETVCGPETETCDALEAGGLRIVTTLDWDLQQAADRWANAAALVPQRRSPRAAAEAIGVPFTPWMRNLRDKDVNNAAIVALDYQTGEIVAYTGSANYYETRRINPKFQPQFDVLADGWRQPGSAFKPFNYVTGINDRTMTAATMFMDVTTDFGNDYIPKDFDLLERGPLRLRSALQMSLNIPAVKALAMNGEQRVFDMAKQFGMTFQDDERPRAGLSMTLGTLEVHPIDLITAYGTLANRGRYIGHTHILRVLGPDGQDLVEPYAPPEPTPVVTPQAAHIMTDVLEGNTRPAVNPFWGRFKVEDAGGEHRPAALKTGTNNDAKDLNAYGFIAPPDEAGRAAGEYALAVGAWNGNSDASEVSTPENPVFSLDVAAPMWEAFLEEVTADWAINDFRRPDGVEEMRVDAFTGMRPGPYSRAQVTELFIAGTAPGEDSIIRGRDVVESPDGDLFLWHEGCPGTPERRGFLHLDEAEADRPGWQQQNRDWIRRARRGPGVAGGPDPEVPTRTHYFYDPSFMPYGRTWGAPFPPTADCDEAPSPSPSESVAPSASPTLEPTLEPTDAAPTEAPTAPPPTQPPVTEPPPPPPTEEPPPPTEEPTRRPTRPPRTPRPTDPPPEPTEPPATEAPGGGGGGGGGRGGGESAAP